LAVSLKRPTPQPIKAEQFSPPYFEPIKELESATEKEAVNLFEIEASM
jgi:hypothetical protein